MEPQVEFSADYGYLSESVDRSGTDASGSPDNQKRFICGRDVRSNLLLQRRDTHALFVVRRHPANCIGAEARDICGLLNPGMCLLRAVDPQSLLLYTQLADVPCRLVLARRKEADDVRHVAAADKQPAA